MFRRKKKEEAVQPVSGAETPAEDARPEAIAAGEGSTSPIVAEELGPAEDAPVAAAPEPAVEAGAADASAVGKSSSRARGNRVQKIGMSRPIRCKTTVWCE